MDGADWKIHVTLQPPGLRSALISEPICCAIDLSPHIFQSFEPLPKDREIDPLANAHARKQIQMRKVQVDQVSEQLAKFLAIALKLSIEQQDTENGYPKKPRTWTYPNSGPDRQAVVLSQRLDPAELLAASKLLESHGFDDSAELLRNQHFNITKQSS